MPASPTPTAYSLFRRHCWRSAELRLEPGTLKARGSKLKTKDQRLKTISIDVIIEIPQGSRNKYEADHRTGEIHLDRVLHSSVHYPTDYGYLPGTLSRDGDPLDVLVVVHDPTFPGCHVPARPIGVLRMRDEKGEDEKILAVPVGDPRFDGIDDLSHLPAHWLKEIENFFATYKLLEEKDTELLGWDDAGVAQETIAEARHRHELSTSPPQ